jgi:hypothetical protein
MRPGEDLEQSREALSKILFTLSRCRISNAKGFEDLLSRLPVHAGVRDGEGYHGGAAARKGKNLRFWCTFGGGRWILVETVGSYV